MPYPHAVDDHQTKNAKVLVNAGAAFLLPQPIVDTSKLMTKLSMLASDKQELCNMGQRARDVAILDATQRVANVCIRLAEKG